MENLTESPAPALKNVTPELYNEDLDPATERRWGGAALSTSGPPMYIVYLAIPWQQACFCYAEVSSTLSLPLA